MGILGDRKLISPKGILEHWGDSRKKKAHRGVNGFGPTQGFNFTHN